nr:uncharacterized protein LOC107383359 [Nothobranchius furzeri]
MLFFLMSEHDSAALVGFLSAALLRLPAWPVNLVCCNFIDSGFKHHLCCPGSRGPQSQTDELNISLSIWQAQTVHPESESVCLTPMESPANPPCCRGERAREGLSKLIQHAEFFTNLFPNEVLVMPICLGMTGGAIRWRLLSSPPSTPHASQPGVPWHVDFHLNLDQMSSAVRRRVEKQQRPLPDERRAFVVALVDQMMQHDQNPSRAMCYNVVRNIVRRHPKSFADIGKYGDTTGDGCYSLLQQVKTRVEYHNRTKTLLRHRRKRFTGIAGEIRQERGPVDQYGCVRWGPVDFPEGETEASLMKMKRDLLNIYSEEGMKGAERAEPMMEKTYVILRQYLNKMPAAAMSDIKEEWPFLFSQKSLLSHFALLTDINVLQKLQAAISQRGQTILDYCSTLDHPNINRVSAGF